MLLAPGNEAVPGDVKRHKMGPKAVMPCPHTSREKVNTVMQSMHMEHHGTMFCMENVPVLVGHWMIHDGSGACL